MVNFYYTFLYNPIFNLLVFLYNIIPGHDVGVAIIVLTIIIKLLLLPLSLKATKSQKVLQDIQPKMDEIKKKYKDNKEAQAKALMDLYKKEKVNPLSSCFPLLIQFPFLIALFQVFRNGFNPSALQVVYPFIHRPDHLNPISLGHIDLSNPIPLLAVLTGIAQFWQTKMLSHKKPPIKSEGAKDESMTAMMNKQMMYVMPILTVFIGLRFPGGLLLYWFVNTLLMILQQEIMFKKDKKISDKNNLK